MNYLRYMQEINMYEFPQGLSFKKTVLNDASFIIHQIINFMKPFFLNSGLEISFLTSYCWWC